MHRSFFQARRALFLDERRAFSEVCHPFISDGKHVGTSWATHSDKACRPLLATESKIVTAFSKNCYVKAQDAQNSHK
jgi:hypothetical protein